MRGRSRRQPPCCSTAAPEAAIVEWSRTVPSPPGTQLFITELDDPIALATMFWNTVLDLPSPGTSILAFPVLSPQRLLQLVQMVHKLEYMQDIMNVTLLEDAPCPALLLDLSARSSAARPTDEENDAQSTKSTVESLQRWVQDVVVDSRVCPYTQSATVSGVGVPGVVPATIGYPVLASARGSDATAVIALLASFWQNCIDLLNTPATQLSSLLLSAPRVACDSHDDFVRVSDAVLQSLQAAGANRYLSLVFFHPLYDRTLVEPQDRLVHGHLPPPSWLPSYLALQQHTDVADLHKANYQRRAPCFVINVLRAEQVALAENVVPWEVIEPEPGRRMRVSGAKIYAQNTWRLAQQSEWKTDPVTGYEYLVVAAASAKSTT